MPPHAVRMDARSRSPRLSYLLAPVAPEEADFLCAAHPAWPPPVWLSRADPTGCTLSAVNGTASPPRAHALDIKPDAGRSCSSRAGRPCPCVFCGHGHRTQDRGHCTRCWGQSRRSCVEEGGGRSPPVLSLGPRAGLRLQGRSPGGLGRTCTGKGQSRRRRSERRVGGVTRSLSTWSQFCVLATPNPNRHAG